MLTATAGGGGTPLSWSQAMALAALLAGLAIAAGLVVIFGRWAARRGSRAQDGITGSDSDFIRSWIAITLVIGLISFGVFTFAINDAALRNTLIGGLIASVGSAIAFYFSSKSADRAQQAIASVAANGPTGTDLVPNLTGLTRAEVAQSLAATAFRLTERPASPPGDRVTTQSPAANSYAPRGSSVEVTFQG
jgi:hypothetical protein